MRINSFISMMNPLYHILNNERVELAKLLLSNGVDGNATDVKGKTAFHHLLNSFIPWRQVYSSDAKEMINLFILKTESTSMRKMTRGGITYIT